MQIDIILKSVAAIIIAYVLGSILPAYFIAKAKGFDIRKRGSGNPGIGNAAGTMGYGIAIVVAMYDIFKSPLAIAIANYIGAPLYISLLSGFVTIIGHIAPFYLKFKGGRGGAASVGIIGYSIVMLLLQDWHFAYFLVPIVIMMGIVFSLRNRVTEYLNAMSLILSPLLLIAIILFYGLNPYSITLSAAICYIAGERINKLLKNKLKEISVEQKALLKRKWLRPFAIVFPLGVLFFKRYTLIVLGMVLSFFVIFEILRFATKFKKFPLRYKKEERTRISSMTMFLFAVFLTLFFFPQNIASLAVMFVIFGDLLAWCIGFGIGGKGFLGKTWIGMAACFITCFTLSTIYYKLGLVTYTVGVAGSIIATLIEIAPIGEDNFVIPVASAVIMTILA